MRKLLVGNLNACLANPRDQREEQLATVLAGYGLTDQAQHFLPRRKYQAEGNWTWRMWRGGRGYLRAGRPHLRDTRQLFYGRPTGT